MSGMDDAALLAAIRALIPEDYEEDDSQTWEGETVLKVHALLYPQSARREGPYDGPGPRPLAGEE